MAQVGDELLDATATVPLTTSRRVALPSCNTDQRLLRGVRYLQTEARRAGERLGGISISISISISIMRAGERLGLEPWYKDLAI